VQALTTYLLTWRRTGGFDEAEVTGGGVPLAEVDPKILESRVAPRVHFAGEVLDAFGPIGGTNFLWAFVTGKLAGEGAAG
jgi:predicted flavoprotein YhiN